MVEFHNKDLPLIAADQWIVSSLLQKSIRRSEVDIAQRAALTLLAQKGTAIWRRLLVIAFEDIGAGSGDALVTAAAATNAAWRKERGGDATVAAHLADVMAKAPKDRSADYLICGAKDHPSLEHVRREILHMSTTQRLDAMADRGRPLEQRAVLAWYASGIEWGSEKQVGKGDLPALLDTFRGLGVPEELTAATGIAAMRTREPITVMVPLVWLAANERQPPAVTDTLVPATTVAGDVPMYALDKHTRLGREAIGQFAQRNDVVRAVLERHVAPRDQRPAAYMAAFYADAAPISRRLAWMDSAGIEAFGLETDLLKVGVPREGHGPILDAVKSNLGYLNEIRSRLFLRTRTQSPNTGDVDRINRFGWTDSDVTFFKIRDGK